MGNKSRDEAIDDLKDTEAPEEAKQEAEMLAEQHTSSSGGSGSVVTKYQLCGKYCDGCLHGPYAWLVTDDGWHYLGKVGDENGGDRAENDSYQQDQPAEDSSHEHEVAVNKNGGEFIDKSDLPVNLPEDDWIQHVDALDDSQSAGLRSKYIADGTSALNVNQLDGDYIRLPDADGERRMYRVSYDGGDSVGLDEVSREEMETDLSSRPLSTCLNEVTNVARRGGAVTVETVDGETWTQEPEEEWSNGILLDDETTLTIEDNTVYLASYEQDLLFPEVGELEGEVVRLDAVEEER